MSDTTLREQIVAEIMKLVKPEPIPLDHKPTVDELERILQEDNDSVSLMPDGTVLVRDKKFRTVGDVADAVMKITNAEMDRLTATAEQFRGANTIQIELRQAAEAQLAALRQQNEDLKAEVLKWSNEFLESEVEGAKLFAHAEAMAKAWSHRAHNDRTKLMRAAVADYRAAFPAPAPAQRERE